MQPPPHRWPARDTGQTPRAHAQRLSQNCRASRAMPQPEHGPAHSTPAGRSAEQRLTSTSTARTTPRRSTGTVALQTCQPSRTVLPPHSSLRTIIGFAKDAISTRATTDDRAERTRNGLRRAPHVGTPGGTPRGLGARATRLSVAGGRGPAPPTHLRHDHNNIFIWSWPSCSTATTAGLPCSTPGRRPGFIPMLLHQATV